MAMMLPIMVGLQMAISVAELEQGELEMQNTDGKVLTDWDKNQAHKKQFIEREVSKFEKEVAQLGGGCPEVIPSFAKTDTCVYLSKPQNGEHAIVRFHKSGGEWLRCLNPADGEPEKCPNETN